MTECSFTECNSIEHDFHKALNMYPNLREILLIDQQQFTLNKINEVKDYFAAEIKERELSKYIALFGHFDKSLIVLSVKTCSISIHKKILKTTRIKKKKTQ